MTARWNLNGHFVEQQFLRIERAMGDLVSA
jgi:hypothetical protein